MTTGTGRPGQATGIEGLRGVSKSVGILAHTFFKIRNPPKESSLCFYQADLVYRFPSALSIGGLAVVSSIIPSYVSSALSCPMDLCLALKDQATSISIIFIAWTSTTITIKNPWDHQTCTWNLLWLSSASFGLRHVFGQISGPVNHVSSRNWLALYVALIQDQLFWPWVVFPEGGPCQ